MAIEKAREYLKKYGLDDKVMEFDVSSATVDLAAKALGCEGKRIAKSLSFMIDDKAILVVTAGDAKVDNAKYKALFSKKAKMLTPEQCENMVGHAVGGVCPFGINDDVKVYLDESLKRFETVYPACGSSNSAIELTPAKLEEVSECDGWVDVCKNWE